MVVVVVVVVVKQNKAAEIHSSFSLSDPRPAK